MVSFGRRRFLDSCPVKGRRCLHVQAHEVVLWSSGASKDAPLEGVPNVARRITLRRTGLSIASPKSLRMCWNTIRRNGARVVSTHRSADFEKKMAGLWRQSTCESYSEIAPRRNFRAWPDVRAQSLCGSANRVHLCAPCALCGNGDAVCMCFDCFM